MSLMLRTLDCLPPTGGAVDPGQTVYLGPNTGPLYRIVAVVEDRAWVREETRGGEHIVSIHRCYPAFED